MVTVYDIPPKTLIMNVAERLKDLDEIDTPPDWAKFVKTAVHNERAPVERDWWYIRMASVLRKIYIKGPIGISHLRAEYSGKRDRGSKRYHARRGGGAIIRRISNDLEKAGLIKTINRKGRIISPKGQKFLDNIAYNVFKDIVKENKELTKY